MGGSVSPPVAGRIEPADDCVKCARLAEFRNDNKRRFPNFFNAPAPPRGPVKAPVMIVGLAPALRGANRTGVTFGGDRSADFLLAAMDRVGLAADPNSDQTGCRLTNAVKCVPPENRPLGAEIRACLVFLEAELAQTDPAVVVALGALAHGAVISAHGLVKAAYPFRHGARSVTSKGRILLASYHPSQQNTFTGRLTSTMLDGVLARAVAETAANPGTPGPASG